MINHYDSVYTVNENDKVNPFIIWNLIFFYSWNRTDLYRYHLITFLDMFYKFQRMYLKNTLMNSQ